jgi:hypothetical protein
VFNKEMEAPPIGAKGNVTAKAGVIGHPNADRTLMGGE